MKLVSEGAFGVQNVGITTNGLVNMGREVAEMASAAMAVAASRISSRAVQNQPSMAAHVHGDAGDRPGASDGGGDGLVLDELAAGRQ